MTISERVKTPHIPYQTNDDDRYFPCIPTPVGMVPFIGSTMSVECEKELFGKKEEESKT